MKYKYIPKQYNDTLPNEEICYLNYTAISQAEVLGILYGLNAFPERLEKFYSFYKNMHYPNYVVIVRELMSE